MGARSPRPLIGVTGPRRGGRLPRVCVALQLRLAGATAVQLAPGSPVPEHLDGVVITGGHDIDPVLYAAVSEIESVHDPERDAFEKDTIERALLSGTPILGICRGAQLVNVVLGGTLFQDLADRRRPGSRHRSILPLEELRLAPGSFVARLMECEQARINRLHHQSIDRLGEGLVVSGRDCDDIVQSVEARDGRFIVGVQWHPEFLLHAAPHRRLFRGLARAARQRAPGEATAGPQERASAASRP